MYVRINLYISGLAHVMNNAYENQKEKLIGSSLSFSHVDSRKQTQVFRLGGKHFYLLSHLAVLPFSYIFSPFYSGDDAHIQGESFLLREIETLSLAHLEVCLLGDSKSQGKLSITLGLIQKYR